MTFDLQKSLNGLLILLTICLGLLAGRFAADWLGLLLVAESPVTEFVSTEKSSVTKARLEDFKTITQRNLFDSNAKPQTLEEPSQSSPGDTKTQAVAPRKVDLVLLGTVAGGESPLAVIRDDKDVAVYRVGSSLPGALTLVSVERDRATAKSASGQEVVLELLVEEIKERTTARRSAPRTRQAVDSPNIIELGENSWQIPREEAEKARSNLNALLKTARMVPKIEDGATVGFTIVNIQPGTFLDMLGLKVGDVLVQINQVELNSPEKALQIFQQVREANNLSLGLLRNGSRQTFEYTID